MLNKMQSPSAQLYMWAKPFWKKQSYSLLPAGLFTFKVILKNPATLQSLRER